MGERDTCFKNSREQVIKQGGGDHLCSKKSQR
jgi:hypothetical protein